MIAPEDRFGWDPSWMTGSGGFGANTLSIAPPAAGGADAAMDPSKLLALLHLGGTFAKMLAPAVPGAGMGYNIDAARANQGAQVGQNAMDAQAVQQALSILSGQQAKSTALATPTSAPATATAGPTANNGVATATPQPAAPASNFSPAPSVTTSGSPSSQGIPDIRLALLGASPEARGQMLDIIVDKTFRERQAAIDQQRWTAQLADEDRRFALLEKADTRADKEVANREAFRASQLENQKARIKIAEDKLKNAQSPEEKAFWQIKVHEAKAGISDELIRDRSLDVHQENRLFDLAHPIPVSPASPKTVQSTLNAQYGDKVLAEMAAVDPSLVADVSPFRQFNQYSGTFELNVSSMLNTLKTKALSPDTPPNLKTKYAALHDKLAIEIAQQADVISKKENIIRSAHPPLSAAGQSALSGTAVADEPRATPAPVVTPQATQRPVDDSKVEKGDGTLLPVVPKELLAQGKPGTVGGIPVVQLPDGTLADPKTGKVLRQGRGR